MTPQATTQFNFAGAEVLVTGGSRGIGLAIADAFLGAGANVTITGTRPTAKAYDTDLSRYRYLQLELSNPAGIENVAASLTALDILINNGAQNAPGAEWARDAFEKSIATNLTGPFALALACKGLLAKSKLTGGGSVINITSMAAYRGAEAIPAYGAAKAALAQLTQTMAVSWIRDKIRVNAIAPGTILTDIWKPLLGDPELIKTIMSRVPIGKFAEPEHISGTALFLASDAASYIVGQSIAVDGGYSILA